MIDTQHIKLAIVHSSDLQNGKKQCCEVSVPLPESLVFNLEQLSVKTAESSNDNDTEKAQTINALCHVVAYWPDNSLKWVKLTYQYANQPHIYLNILKEQFQASATPAKKLIHSIGDKTNDSTDTNDTSDAVNPYAYKCGVKTLTLNLTNNRLELLDGLDSTSEVVLSFTADDLKLTDSQGQPVKTDFNHVSATEQINLKNHTSSAIEFVIHGCFSGSLIQFELTVNWLAPFDLLKFDLQIHNTDRAIHQGGKWDLGDAGSFNFKALSVDLNTSEKSFKEHSTLTDIQNNHSYNGDDFSCEQFSSGGVNWQSPVHVNHNNTVDIKQNGYVLLIDQKQQSGMRCQPVVGLKNNLAITLNQFWQNFPTSLNVKENRVSFGLFPETHYLHELQGGEKKTHTFWVSLNGTSNDLTSNDQIARGSVDWDWIQQCGLYPFMGKEKANLGSLQAIIDLGISPTAGFIAKRENLDEYGWRNFGELFADHETAGYQGEDIFVSHYNNQYDPIYGFIRQYLTTGNTQWFELADELATHVKDIDIYHTNLDKNEYNGGLFWHTDHYLQAFTSSHRSYSKHQASDAYQDHAGGGGPGGQHCYTTGLYLHYCLTGNQHSKDAVLTLSNWITHVYEGSGTCLELLLAFKNRHIAGYKNHFTGQYPLDRGIANYINALLDSFELTQQEDYLTQVQNILANTMHPGEDIVQRDLQDVENTWFYTVLLQALCRYLQVKESRQEFDQHFYYCRDCLLNFADWMLEHEYPYLEKPDILEYPNDTWTAQDLRKSHVLAGAFYYSPDKKNAYISKAEFFQQYVAGKLKSSDSKTYTRILVLMMQNQGAVEVFQTQQSTTTFAPKQSWPAANYQQTSLYGGLCKVLIKRLIKLSPKAELDWLKKRLA